MKVCIPADSLVYHKKCYVLEKRVLSGRRGFSGTWRKSCLTKLRG